MPKVVITGANGFLGSYLVAFFSGRGWKVKALVHNMPQQVISGVEYHLYNLLAAPQSKIIEGADCVIHCAYAPNDFDVNVKGTAQLLDVSRKCGVRKNIFISSISASEGALSVYGKQKWACEKLYYQPTDLILRPGLILGNGGLFGQMKEYLKKKRLIPLIQGGKQPLQTVYIDDLAQIIIASIEKGISGLFTIASPEKTLYKEFYPMLCVSVNRLPIYMVVYYWQLYIVLSIANILRIKLPVSRENLLGLKQLKYVDTTGGLAKLGITLKTSRESLALLK